MHNPFEIFNLEPCVFVDKQELDLRFQKMQALVHPDLHRNALSEDAAKLLSLKVVDSYEVLKDPQSCVRALLTLKDFEITLTTTNMDILEENLSYQERFVHENPVDLALELSIKLKDIAKNIEKSFSCYLNFTEDALRFFYLYKLFDRVQQKIFEERMATIET